MFNEIKVYLDAMTLPTTISISNFEELQQNISILDSKKTQQGNYILDLSGYVNFVRPLFIVTIAQFVRYYRALGFNFIDIKLDDDATNKSSSYLRSIDFEKRFHNNFEASPEFNCPDSSLPITTVLQEEIPNKKIKIVKFLQDKGIEKDFTSIEVCLDEILNNCFDHADSKTGVVAHAQYLRTKKSIWLAICDTGIGLPNCVNNYMQAQYSRKFTSEEAINWAFTNTNTTKSTPRNRGLGLNNLLDQTNYHEGEFRMITYDKWVLNSPKIKLQMRDTKYFFGTAIEIEIKLDNLNELEFSDFEYF